MFGDIAVEAANAGATSSQSQPTTHGSAPATAQDNTRKHRRCGRFETGRWIVRAASTGISGIIAPDGTWTQRTELMTQSAVVGDIGPPMNTFYTHIGPQPIGLASLAFVLLAPHSKRRLGEGRTRRIHGT